MKKSNEVISKMYTTEIEEITTAFVAQLFSNRIFIIITQCKAFGSLVDISKDDNNSFRPDNAEIPISVRFLLGVEETTYKIIARKIAAVVFRDTDLPILLSIALKVRTPKVFNKVLDRIQEVNVWE